MAVSPGHGFHAVRDEKINWYHQRTSSGIAKLPLDIDTTRNFVAFNFAQLPGQVSIDIQAVEPAYQVALHLSGLSELDSAPQLDAPPIHQLEEERFVQTILIAQTVLLPSAPDDRDDSISRAFDVCLNEFQDLERAYIATTADLQYRVSSRQRLLPLCFYCLLDPLTAHWSKPSLFGLNMAEAIMPPPPSLGAPEIGHMTIRWQRMRRQDPFTVFVPISSAAARSLYIDGDFTEAVIKAYTAAEVLLDTVLVSLAWEEIEFWPDHTLSRDQVVGWFTRRSTLDTRLANCFKGRLKGWDVGNRNKLLYLWRTQVARLRHRTIHAGYRPTEQEAASCIDLGRELEEHLKDLLASDSNRSRYPRTALMYLGRPGLAKRGKYVGKLKELDESSMNLDWTGELIVFRDWLSSQLSRVDN
jgi:hypothetical protein